MPKILEDLRQKIVAKQPGLSKSSSYAIATNALQKQGKMPKKRYAEGGTAKADNDRQAAIRQAAGADSQTNRQVDERARAINELIAPPGPRATGNVYRKGGKVRRK